MAPDSAMTGIVWSEFMVCDLDRYQLVTHFEYSDAWRRFGGQRTMEDGSFMVV